MINMKRFFDKIKNQSGSSLLEVLLYVGLASIILMVIGSSVLGIIQIRVKSQTVSEVEQQGTQVVQKISQAIRNAESIINITSTSTVQNIKVQRGIADMPNTGGTQTAPSDFDAFSSMTSAFVLNSNNHNTNSGFTSNNGNMEVDDVSGAITLTDTGTISFYREAGSNVIDTRFHWEAWEYIGEVGGPNEFIVRGRFNVSMSAGTRTATDTVTACNDRDKCIPFITGILNSDPSDDMDEATAIAWMSADDTVSVERGGNTNTTEVYGVVVEFTGSNWSVGHGRTGDVNGDTGSINLVQESVGTSGTTYNVSSWSNAVIFNQFKGDDSANNAAIADVSAVYFPGAGTSIVDWSFHTDHDGVDNQHMIHILENPDMTVTRFSDNGSAEGDNVIDVSSAGLTDLSNSSVVGSANSSGGGTAYARGWKGIYLATVGSVNAWAHRSGNTIDVRVQVIEFPLSEILVVGSSTTTTQDIVIQRGMTDIPNTGGSQTAPTDFTAFGSMTSAFVLNSSNRYTNSGPAGNANTMKVDDMSGAVVLTATNTIDFYRQSGSLNSDFRFNWESWEYIGADGGPNEFIVRGRFQVDIDAGSRTAQDTVDYCETRVKCIPFVTGILSSGVNDNSDNLTALAWMSSDNKVTVERGGDTSLTQVYGVVVEFTGSNWTVAHGRTDDVSADTGTIKLKQKSSGISSGDNYFVNNWNNAIIFHQFKGDDNNGNKAIADTSAIYSPGIASDEVDWYFDGNHDANDNQHMVHILENPDMTVYRYADSGSLEGDNIIGIIDVDPANTAVVGSSESSGTGTAFGRGWKGIYLSSSNTINAWAHRSGNAIETRAQLIIMPQTEWTFKLQLVNYGGDTIRYGISNGGIFVRDEGKYYFLTSDRVVASGLYFDDYSRSGTAGLISFGFDLDYNSDSIRNEFVYSKFFQSSASILNK